MDGQRSWHQIFASSLERCDLSQSNLTVHVDGGTRGNTCSATAWLLEADTVDTDTVYTIPLAMSG
eukprot:2619643-Karenia_brevis.AAC.1